MKLSELKPPAGAKHARKRRGRGTGSGHGKTAGRGTKGQGARAGSGIPMGYEGGQTPLKRRVPKRGFVNIFKKHYHLVKLKDLEKFARGTVVGLEEFRRAGLIKRRSDRIKILGNGELKGAFTVKAHKFTRSARERIEAAGGKAEVI